MIIFKIQSKLLLLVCRALTIFDPILLLYAQLAKFLSISGRCQVSYYSIVFTYAILFTWHFLLLYSQYSSFLSLMGISACSSQVSFPEYAKDNPSLYLILLCNSFSQFITTHDFVYRTFFLTCSFAYHHVRTIHSLNRVTITVQLISFQKRHNIVSVMESKANFLAS